MLPEIQRFLSLAEAIALLLHPFAEVVMHDLATSKIVAIFNSFSHRQIGDDSLLEEIEFDPSQTIIGPYEKLNWNGHRLKSISVVIQGETGQAIGLVCINLDVSKFDELRQILDQFTHPDSLLPQPQALFKDDWQEKINLYVHDYLRRNHKSLESLSRSDKRSLVELLNQEGAFNQKNAATYIGKVLGISRATVYNYLSEST